MRETIKARFVGGPKHNQFMECDRLPVIHVIRPQPVPIYFDPDPKFYEAEYATEDYLLFRFVSEGGAHYSQYVHQSMIRNGEPSRDSFRDADLPAMPWAMAMPFIDRLIAWYKKWNLL